jgi:hypothetical protein
VGGEDDGGIVFPFFSFDLLKLYDLMDSIKYMRINNGISEYSPVVMAECVYRNTASAYVY